MLRALLVLLAALAALACFEHATAPRPSLTSGELGPIIDVESFEEGDRRSVMLEQLGGLLHEKLPADAPVLVRLDVGLLEMGLWGFTQYQPEGFYLIVLDARLPGAIMSNTLIHEWAHAIAYDANHEDSHGPTWGVAYAAAYLVLQEWNSLPWPDEEESDE